MNPILSGTVSTLFYLSATLFLFIEILQKKTHKISIYLAWLAAISHTVYNLSTLFLPNGIDFSFFNTASLILMIVVFILLFATFTKPVIKLGIALFPTTAVILILGITIPVKSQILQTKAWQMDVHIVTSIIAFSLLNIAAFQALLLAVQDWQLRNHRPNQLIQSLPPLQTMESLLFQMIGTGLFFLSISLLSGFIFIEDLFAQHLVHKTVLSIFAWFTFSGLLAGRSRYGWRGQTAIRWTLIGFVSLLLAYFGSKLVLELILKY